MIDNIVKVRVRMILGETKIVNMHLMSSVRECLEESGIGALPNTIQIIFFKGKRIIPDLTVASIGIEDGDSIIIFNKKIKRKMESLQKAQKEEIFTIPQLIDPHEQNLEKSKMIDRSFIALDNGKDPNYYYAVLLEKQKESEEELDKKYELLQKLTILPSTSGIQTLPLPGVYHFSNDDFEVSHISLSPLNPIKKKYNIPQNHSD